MVTLGGFDIHYAVNTLAQHTVAAREGHFFSITTNIWILETTPTCYVDY
jgi:hypothetical protein